MKKLKKIILAILITVLTFSTINLINAEEPNSTETDRVVETVTDNADNSNENTLTYDKKLSEETEEINTTSNSTEIKPESSETTEVNVQPVAQPLMASAFRSAPSVIMINEDWKINGKNYLAIGKDYYSNSNITKGYLDKIIKDTVSSEVYTKLQEANANGSIVYTDDMTFNMFYIANELSPEDNSVPFSDALKITMKNGKLLNAITSPKRPYDLTFVGPANYEQAISGTPYKLYSYGMFSRLTVGGVEENPNNENYKLGKFDNYLSPDLLGYKYNSTVNDYMLTQENNFVIPARYNTKRDDVYLTMRGNVQYGLRGAQAFLEATSLGETVKGSAQDPKFYLDTETVVAISKTAFNNLGFTGRLQFPAAQRTAKNLMRQVGINEFANTLNPQLRNLENNSGAKTIAQGFGGQIKITGFYRKSDIDETYTATADQRNGDSVNYVDVSYFMYTNRDTASGALNNDFADVPEKYAGKVSKEGNILKLYSPNVVEYKIETTRPFFKDFGDLNTAIKYVVKNETSDPNDVEETASDFNALLGVDTFNLEDNGIDINGNKIAVNKDLVRVRIKDVKTDTISTYPYTLEELKTRLSKAENNEELELIYVYPGVDAAAKNPEIIGKLPNEINDNLGAYAIPMVRKVKVTNSTYVKGSKTWVDNDNKNKTRPTNIIVRLFNDKNVELDNKSVTETDKWEYVFEGVSVYSKANEDNFNTYNTLQPISYVIKEDAVNNYKTDIVGYNITNTFIENKPVNPTNPKTPTTPTIKQDPIKPKWTCADEGKTWDEAKQMCVGTTHKYNVPNTATSQSPIIYIILLVIGLSGLGFVFFKKNQKK